MFGRDDSRQEVCERLAGARPGCDNKVASRREGLLDRFGHLQLARADLAGGKGRHDPF
jgi:hypothetical protein